MGMKESNKGGGIWRSVDRWILVNNPLMKLTKLPLLHVRMQIREDIDGMHLFGVFLYVMS